MKVYPRGDLLRKFGFKKSPLEAVAARGGLDHVQKIGHFRAFTAQQVLDIAKAMRVKIPEDRMMELTSQAKIDALSARLEEAGAVAQ